MDTGRILVAQTDGTHIIKLLGDVRMTLCTTIEACLKRIFDDNEFKDVIIDLTETIGIDSTSLGLLAKISIESQQRVNKIPVLVSNNQDITRVLESMGFKDRVFNITSQTFDDKANLVEVPLEALNEEKAHESVVEAHKILMNLNENNFNQFKDLVVALENGQN